MAEKLPTDPCGYCGCMRKYHNPPKAYTSSKFRIGLTGTMIKVLAPTCCDSCPHCICSCVAFVEPFEGQKRLHCVHETENHDHDFHTEWDSYFDYSISRVVSPVQSGIPVTQGMGGVSSSSKLHITRKTVQKKTKLKNTVKPRGSGGLF
jgi:hypothetical protein